MSSIPGNLKYLDSHEWARVESDGTVTVGISDHAQGALGDLVFVEVPEVGKALTKGGAAAVVESVKAASDVYSPVSGEVVANNSEALSATPELVNSDPYGQGWLFKVKPSDSGELGSLLDAKAYEKVVEEAGH
jgi:glycine cleavage system H protein